MHSVVPLFWAVIVIVIMTFCFAAVFVQGIEEYIDAQALVNVNVQGMKSYYNSLGMAILTLFMSITGGLSWWEAARPLLGVSLGYLFLFCGFVVLALIVAMNIFTGIFVNDALSLASMNRDMLALAEEERGRANEKLLRCLFKEADLDGSGELDLDEFEQFFANEDAKSTVASMGVANSNAAQMFKELDVDEDLTIDVEDFVSGCLGRLGKEQQREQVSETFRMMVLTTKHVKQITEEVSSLRTATQSLFTLLDDSHCSESGAVQGFRSSAFDHGGQRSIRARAST